MFKATAIPSLNLPNRKFDKEQNTSLVWYLVVGTLNYGRQKRKEKKDNFSGVYFILGYVSESKFWTELTERTRVGGG